MVQIVKEPISTKGPRLIGEISFVGRLLVLVPFGHEVNVSSRIRSGEGCARLKQLIQSITPKNFGAIVRTVTEGRHVAGPDAEMKVLLSRWDKVIIGLQKTQEHPQLVLEETGHATVMLRDFLNPTYENICINGGEIRTVVRHYVSLTAPEGAGIVRKYTGKTPIFNNSDVTKQIRSSFGKTIGYGRGCYSIIKHTEVVYVVDVNSGNRARKEAQEQNAPDTSLGAADELARQLRLHDMGRIIIVGLIDMNLAGDRQMLYERMCKNMQKDCARHNTLPLSKFGLMRVTRQRVRPMMDVDVNENYPICLSTGKIRSSILFTDQSECKIGQLVDKVGIKEFYLHIRPYVAVRIGEGPTSLRRKWQMKYNLDVNIISSQESAYLQYEFYDTGRQFVDMKERNDKSRTSY